jgi:cyclic pyranopterin phosphate synthase
VLYTCLFATAGLDLRAPLRAGASDEELLASIRGCWQARSDRYSELRGKAAPQGAARVEMNHVGG